MPSKRRGNWRVYLVSILIAFAAGLLGFLLSRSGMEAFESLNRPPWSPPSWFFPVVWSILFLLMGISVAIVYQSGRDGVNEALRAYLLQLALNVGWSAIFFTFRLYLAAFVWLLALIAAILLMVVRFVRVEPVAGYLQIPYLLWCLFAAALNLSIVVLN